jgi:hypothetical protein
MYKDKHIIANSKKSTYQKKEPFILKEQMTLLPPSIEICLLVYRDFTSINRSIWRFYSQDISSSG